MRYFPAFFDLRGRAVIVVGGGELAVRKLRLLMKADPFVTVVSAEDNSAVAAAFGDRVRRVARPLLPADLTPRPALIVIATEDEAAARVALDLAHQAGIPVNAVDRPAQCDVVIPSIVERGEMAIGISTGGAAPVLGRRVRERLEALLPARLGDLIAFAAERRDAVAHAVPASRRRGFWERLFDGPAAEAVLAGDQAAAETAFTQALSSVDEGQQQGHVAIIGAGPGDPELLTLKALRYLQEADVVLYDNLVSDAVLELIRRDAARHYVGKKRADHALPQEEIATLMIAHARQGARVVRLKGGDPFIFGRGGEELEALRAAGVAATIVPGITAAAGCAAATGIPLTHRGLSQAVTFVTAEAGKGGAPDINWSALAALRHTVAVYMGVRRAGQVANALIAAGRGGATPVAVIERGTLPEQRIIRTHLSALCAGVAHHEIKGPALLIIGEVAALADDGALREIVAQGGLAA
ncbi:Uroporphyrin-III C-methyltransferase-like [Parvularcula bermudensis HTCC2503]|uniref:Uroporphyrin-III C-methyltransferase-like n=1 Tax=Parvularcula bermudensis (strain ATCC BAA-594 / HTCC2503 / KCTC 12087) TaxID=314260 RepID=E0TFQ2_PARBH|nr:siroheme synthase CysG [Parvularcula bermudensis]ADM09067.1 Uroporphyrin-III C-methyltransferase-like [Parvularcula bermudensis HTCC2503]